MKLKLKRLLKKRPVTAIIQHLCQEDSSLYLTDNEGRSLLGERGTTIKEYPVLLNGEILGFCGGENRGLLLASLLSCLAEGELEKRFLGQETLDKYKEINLLYETTEKMTAILNQKEVAQLILEEIKRIIPCDEIKAMMKKEEQLQLLASWKKGEGPICLYKQEEITHHVMDTGKAEIVNSIRCPEENQEGSLMCTPLKIKEEVFGFILVLILGEHTYSAGDLKILSALAFQSASALENIRLFQDYLAEQRDREKVTRIFGRYVAPQVAEEILKGSEQHLGLGGISREVTVFFIDIRGFTSLTEEMAPEQVVKLLNQFFDTVTRCIFENKGTIDKYAGDGAMAFFNAPLLLEDHALWALRAARSIQKEQPILQERVKSITHQPLEFRMGINTGDVVLGNIGTENRMEYTVIGSTVNLASRLEEMASPGQILVSESVYQKTQGEIPLKPIGRRSFRGLKKPIMVYELIQ